MPRFEAGMRFCSALVVTLARNSITAARIACEFGFKFCTNARRSTRSKAVGVLSEGPRELDVDDVAAAAECFTTGS